MSQRNPMNDRYTQDGERAGKTRKSAASAKPATKAASSVRVQGQKSEKPKGLFSRAQSQAGKTESKGKSKPSAVERARVYDVPTPEYRRWRRIWVAVLVSAIVFTTLSFVAMNSARFSSTHVPTVLLGVGYALLAATLGIDMLKVRKIRNKYNEGTVDDRSKEATRTRKQQKAAERQRFTMLLEEEQRRNAEREQKAAARNAKIGRLFGRGPAEPADADAADEAAGKAADADAADVRDAGKKAVGKGKA